MGTHGSRVSHDACDVAGSVSSAEKCVSGGRVRPCSLLIMAAHTAVTARQSQRRRAWSRVRRRRSCHRPRLTATSPSMTAYVRQKPYGNPATDKAGYVLAPVKRSKKFRVVSVANAANG